LKKTVFRRSEESSWSEINRVERERSEGWGLGKQMIQRQGGGREKRKSVNAGNLRKRKGAEGKIQWKKELGGFDCKWKLKIDSNQGKTHHPS